MEAMMDMDLLRERLATVDALPALPSTVSRLIRGLNSEVGAADLEAIVRTDEAVSAAVLRLANSAVHGQNGRAFTLQESIARVGAQALQRIAISLQCESTLETGCAGFGLLRGQLWTGAIGGAVAAELVAKKSGIADPGVCFVAGLLRDVGKLAVEQLFGEPALMRAFTRSQPAVSQLELETAELGVAHPVVGAELARIWQIPEEIVVGIEHHHDPDAGVAAELAPELQALCDVVHCGDSIAMMMGLGVGHDGLAYRVSERARTALGLTRRAVEEYMPLVRSGIGQLVGEPEQKTDQECSSDGS